MWGRFHCGKPRKLAGSERLAASFGSGGNVIKLKYSEFMSFGFANAFQKLTQHPYPASSNVGFRIKKIGEIANKMRESIRLEYQALLGEYAKKDENGQILHPDPTDINSYDVPEEKAEAFKAAEKAFGEKELTLPRLPLQGTDLGDLKLSAADEGALAGVLTRQDPEEMQEAATVTPMKIPS